ncbi:MAG: NAD-dependent epimerase/dehydratase family protein [Rhodospirillales bacterium]
MAETAAARLLTPDLIRAAMRRERVMLVGGAGFIGHNLALELRRYGAETMVIDNLMLNNMVANVSDTGTDPLKRTLYHDFLMQRFELMRDAGVVLRNADARALSDLTEAFQEFTPTKVVHLAAIASAVEARRQPGMCFDLQLVTLRNVLEICRVYKTVNQVVFMSSSTVYGDFKTETVDESVRPRPYGIYANAKFMGERLVRTYSDQYGLGCAVIRPSALYGERCISRRVSQKFVENALSGKPLLLEGGGGGRLDFTHISDLADGIVRAMAAMPGPGDTNTFNLTFGDARTIRDLAEIVKSVIPHAVLEERPRDGAKPVRGTLSTARAREQLNFIPQAPLETAYKAYCEWYVEQWDRAQRRLTANI